MRYFEAAPRIAASPEAVWAVLCDGASWPSWDSGADAVEGRIAPGESITIRSQAAPGRAFPVAVTEFAPPVRLRLSGGMPLGLFRGIRAYDMSVQPDGCTLFHIREEYTGYGRSTPARRCRRPPFQQFARGLRRRAGAGG